MILTQINKRFFKLLLIAGATFASISCCTKKATKEKASNNLIQACPEEWFQNKMPGPASKEASEYFIYEGKRRELKEFDLAWIQKNCDIKPLIVQ